jgi:hypothetical protein
LECDETTTVGPQIRPGGISLGAKKGGKRPTKTNGSESASPGGGGSPGSKTPRDEESNEAAESAGAGWRVGDDVYAATRAGNEPSWSTVRARFWKNTAADPETAAQWDQANLARMRRGLAPQRFNPDKGGIESMELSHEPTPFREGGQNIVPRWPQDHAAQDPFHRFPGY